MVKIRSTCALSVLIFFVAFIVYLLPGGTAPFFTRGEAREALVIRAMLDQNNFVLPLRNGVDIPSKPPLYHWLAAGAARLFDSRSELLLRLPTSAAAALLLAAFFFLAARRIGDEAAFCAALILGTSLDFARAASVARVDMTFACWVALGTWCLFELIENFREQRRVYWPLLFLASVLLALAGLSKGPAGIALPWIVAGIYTLFRLPLRQIPFVPAIISVAISTGIAGLWYLSAWQQGGQAFLDVHLMRENVARVVGMQSYNTGHKGNPLELPPMLLIGLFPWSIFLIPLAFRLYRGRRELLCGEDPAALFALIWGVFYLVFFALVSSKRNVYLLPSFPAWAYLLGSHARLLAQPALSGHRASELILRGTSGIIAVLAIAVALSFAVPVVGGFHLMPRDRIVAEEVLAGLQAALPFLVLTLALALRAAGNFRAGDFIATTHSLAAALIVLLASSQLLVLRRVAYLESPRSFMLSVRAYLPPNLPLYQYRDDYYAANYYSDRDVTQIDKPPLLTDPDYGFMIAAETSLPEARAAFGQLDTIVESNTLNVYGRDKFLFVRFRGQ